MDCCDYVEPCHANDCDGFDEIVRLLPSGALWQPNQDNIYSNYIRALGHIKTVLNQMVCQEHNELDPCKTKRLFSYWAKIYRLPKCVEQTPKKLCEWITLIYGDCAIGSQGFINKVIQFVIGNDVNVQFKLKDEVSSSADSLCADNNNIIVTAPVKYFKYTTYDADFIHERPDGVNCRKYFIPEIECLRECVFTFGLSLGYKTAETGKHDINQWQDVQQGELESSILQCGDDNDRFCN